MTPASEVTQAARLAVIILAELERQQSIGAGEVSICPDSGLMLVSMDIDAGSLARAVLADLQAAIDAAKAEQREVETYAEFQQRRGRLPDLIEGAIAIFDNWMADDDYDARGCLDQVIDKLKAARDFYDAKPLQHGPAIYGQGKGSDK